MTITVAERKTMKAGIHHTNYRVVPAAFAAGFWVGICKVCPPGNKRFVTARNGNSHTCETHLIAHLKDKHGVTETSEEEA